MYFKTRALFFSEMILCYALHLLRNLPRYFYQKVKVKLIENLFHFGIFLLDFSLLLTMLRNSSVPNLGKPGLRPSVLEKRDINSPAWPYPFSASRCILVGIFLNMLHANRKKKNDLVVRLMTGARQYA